MVPGIDQVCRHLTHAHYLTRSTSYAQFQAQVLNEAMQEHPSWSMFEGQARLPKRPDLVDLSDARQRFVGWQHIQVERSIQLDLLREDLEEELAFMEHSAEP